MKIIHLSDLHLGKRVNEFSMIEDQADILEKILMVIDGEKPDAVVIAGDIYDKAVPSVEAVNLFDRFLNQLAMRELKTMVISGNHDSPDRIAFASRLISISGVYLSPVYDGSIAPVTLFDEYGPVHFYLLPFIKPVHVRQALGREDILTYTDAMRAAVGAMHIDSRERNVLVTHQFLTGAVRSESEEVTVGTADNVDASVFSDFDYVALGHLHGPQNVGSERIRYCGTPLKYSFSEAEHKKSVTVVTLGEKGSFSLHTVPLVPRHDMRRIKGTYDELANRSFYEGTARDDYLMITLTDEEDIVDAIGKLRVIYPNLMKLAYDNTRTRSGIWNEAARQTEKKSPFTLFEELYEKQNGKPFSDEQAGLVRRLISEIWEES